ncbi:MAG: flavodoxin family protein [Lawsonibacter sp.]
MPKSLAGQLGAQYKSHDYTQPKGRENALQFGPDELVVLGTPVYAGRVPNMMLPFVQNSIHGEGTLAVPVVLYGNRNFDDGLMELKQVMTANGFLPIAGAAIVGEHSFSTILGAGRPDGEDMALVDQLARQTAEKVKGLTALPESQSRWRAATPSAPTTPPGPQRRAHQGLPEG